jgi:hypothetical protein
MAVNVQAASTALHTAWAAVCERALDNQPLEDALSVLRERLHGILVDVDALVTQHGE